MTARRAPNPQPRVEDADALRRLLTAQRAIGDDLALGGVLGRVVQAARELVGARYGVLAIFDADGSVEQVVHQGLDRRTVAAAGSRPGALSRGVGLIGTLPATPGTGVLRVADLADRPSGAPTGYPDSPMRALLGVPIEARGERLGELYLADPEAGHFDQQAEELAAALAGSAATAIENARLYEEVRRSRDWLNAAGEVARTLLADADEQVLLEVVSRALSVAEADYAALLLPIDGDRLRVTVAKGLGAARFEGLVFDPMESVLGRAILAAESLRTHDFTLWTDPEYANPYGFGPAMIAPLADAQGCRGAVVLLRTADRVQFNAHEAELATTFATQVALALELNDARADSEWLRVLEDRHRIAQDLHDNVMQRLFATGVGLQALAEQHRADGDPELTDRLLRYIGDLDETIDQIRSRVFGLRDDAVTGLLRHRTRVPRVARRAAAAALGAGTVALRTLTPAALRRDESPTRVG